MLKRTVRIPPFTQQALPIVFFYRKRLKEWSGRGEKAGGAITKLQRMGSKSRSSMARVQWRRTYGTKIWDLVAPWVHFFLLSLNSLRIHLGFKEGKKLINQLIDSRNAWNLSPRKVLFGIFQVRTCSWFPVLLNNWNCIENLAVSGAIVYKNCWTN